MLDAIRWVSRLYRGWADVRSIFAEPGLWLNKGQVLGCGSPGLPLSSADTVYGVGLHIVERYVDIQIWARAV